MVYFALGALVLLLHSLPATREHFFLSTFGAVLCAFLFFLLGALSRQLGRLQSQTVEIADLVDALAKERFGSDYYAVRAAVSALIADLPSIGDEAARSHVIRAIEELTGQAFGDDPSAWRDWWLEAQASFEVAASARGAQTAHSQTK